MVLPGHVIQLPKLEPRIGALRLSDFEWAAIKPLLPNKPRGVRACKCRRVSMASLCSCVQALTPYEYIRKCWTSQPERF